MAELRKLRKQAASEARLERVAARKNMSLKLKRLRQQRAAVSRFLHPTTGFCHCRRRTTPSMVDCDSGRPDCPGNGWYHFACVGLDRGDVAELQDSCAGRVDDSEDEDEDKAQEDDEGESASAVSFPKRCSSKKVLLVSAGNCRRWVCARRTSPWTVIVSFSSWSSC